MMLQLHFSGNGDSVSTFGGVKSEVGGGELTPLASPLTRFPTDWLDCI